MVYDPKGGNCCTNPKENGQANKTNGQYSYLTNTVNEMLNQKVHCGRAEFPTTRPVAKALAIPKQQTLQIARALENEQRTLEREREAIARRKSEIETERQRIKQDEQAITCILPPYWRTKHWDQTSYKCHKTNYLVKHIHEILETTSCRYCFGFMNILATTSYGNMRPIMKIRRVENILLWKTYSKKRLEIREKHQVHKNVIDQLDPAVSLRMDDDHESQCKLDCAVNETYLLHGVKNASVVTPEICRDGFDARVANLNGRYGAGIYFAEQACKAFQYAEQDVKGWRHLIYGRVTLGRICTTSLPGPRMRRPPPHYDSVVARGDLVHREFVVYDGSQIYPEFIISFRKGTID